MKREEEISSRPQREQREAAEAAAEKEALFAREALSAEETGTQQQAEDSAQAGEPGRDSVREESRELRELQSSEPSASSSAGAGAGAAAGGAAAVAAVAAAVVIVTGGLFGGIQASITDLTPAGSQVDYAVETTLEWKDDGETVLDLDHLDTGLVLVLSGGGESHTAELRTGQEGLSYTVETRDKGGGTREITFSFTGTITGLSAGTRYHAALVGEEDGKTKTYDTRDLKTGAGVTRFDSIDYTCQCTVDGCFYFQLHYTDDNGYYRDFRYQLENRQSGEIVASGVLSEPLVRQAVPGADTFPGTDYRLTVFLHSDSPEDLKNGQGELSFSVDAVI